MLTDGLAFHDNQLLFEAESTAGKKRGKGSKPPPNQGGSRDVSSTRAGHPPSSAITTDTAASFVPRAAKSRPKIGLGHKKALGKAPVSSTFVKQDGDTVAAPTHNDTGKGQDDFRKMLSGS